MRMRFNFWLDIHKDDELEIAETIHHLKQNRLFSRAIRDGIRLFADLSRGNINVLFELFPWVWDKIALEVETARSEQTSENTVIEVPIRKQLEEITNLLLQQRSLVTDDAPRIPARVLSAKEDPDIQLEIQNAKFDKDNRPNWNFLISSALNVYGNCNNLPREVVEYGLRTNRIPPHMITKKPTKAKAEKGPKAMDVPQFEAPSFDDFDQIEVMT